MQWKGRYKEEEEREKEEAEEGEGWMQCEEVVGGGKE